MKHLSYFITLLWDSLKFKNSNNFLWFPLKVGIENLIRVFITCYWLSIFQCFIFLRIVSFLTFFKRPLLSMNKTFFYNFFPSKAEEEASKVNNTPHVVTWELVEMRDLYPTPTIDWNTNVRSRKTLSVTRLM